ncbi:hypothetical protein PHET_07151 [Paragonimus heterotremus]|uniref:LIM zinc-binding domain-containing protein n=1 Tax=Paragonimus heterotremus TaxID=100268 RepID=A0A8J4T809_9TREM|nr:hypothetical protein PHET_07151 [Paragonimus heterotremus]
MPSSQKLDNNKYKFNFIRPLLEVMSPLFNHNGFDILHDHLIEGISIGEKVAATALVDQTSSYFGHVCQTAVATTPSPPVRDSQRSLCGYCGLDLSSLDASVQLPTAAYHFGCFRCNKCRTALSISTAKWMEIAPYCPEHYAECEKPRYEAKLSPPVKTTKRTFVVQNFKPSIKTDSNMSKSESSLNVRPASANLILQTKISGYSPPPRHRMLRLSQRNSIESALPSFIRTPHTQSTTQLNRQSPNAAHFHRDVCSSFYMFVMGSLLHMQYF